MMEPQSVHHSSFIIHHSPSPPSVAIIGGGLAGLAAAVRLAERGVRVEVFEARTRLGGRAASMVDPGSGLWIDRCQHVALGCCTELADLCRRTGLEDCFERHRRLHFFAPDGSAVRLRPRGRGSPRRCICCPRCSACVISTGKTGCGSSARWAGSPAPFRVGDVLILAVSGRKMCLSPSGRATTMGDWLRGQGESDAAIEGFWSVVLQSRLGRDGGSGRVCRRPKGLR